ncbi:putative dehydrogenase [Dyadobacter jejuensis]|uniref:Putative dehydrogenase n=1 Tax=Dyadobacter jejuensis TaxID=1082580 RepID=A0A316ANX0_9BACT|nr:Gfo/Idh/MocA family oxidoreductase [Dyadobacter jejuensis]PWJ59242.1 putative dehydrogenase [Dyadobacter jejuensis]
MTKELDHLKRREFLKAGAVLAAFSIVPRHVLGKGYTAPSDRHTLGFIGCGRKGNGLRTPFLNTGKVQIVAASDAYASKQKHFLEATDQWYAEKNNKGSYKSVTGYSDFRELLARKDIDAVVIASPDHWHGSMAVLAANAGKDIYCEKPLSLTVKEGRAMVDATRKNNRVFQTGSMQRSAQEFRQAVQLVRSGVIGKVQKVVVNVGGPPKAWDLTSEPLVDGLDWNAWVGPNVNKRPFNHVVAPPLDADFWPKWRDYDEFGGGGMTDWGAHMFDIAQWGLDMDSSGPVEVVYSEPDQGLVYKYANGVEMVHQPMSGSNFCQFIGSDGTVWVSRGKLKVTPETMQNKEFESGAFGVYDSQNHYLDFLKAIETRKPPICDVETGHRTATICNLGNIAYKLKRSLRWDPLQEIIAKDPEATRLLGRKMDPEWDILNS